MESTLLLIQNIAAQTESPEEVTDWIEGVRQCLRDVFEAIAEGEAE